MLHTGRNNNGFDGSLYVNTYFKNCWHNGKSYRSQKTIKARHRKYEGICIWSKSEFMRALYWKSLHYLYPENYYLFSVQNKASPSDNFWLKLPRTDWFENLSDKFTLKQIVKQIVQSKKWCSVWLVSKLISNTACFLSKINVFSGNYCDKWAVNAYGMLNV